MSNDPSYGQRATSISISLADRYELERANPILRGFLQLAARGRKFGFPVACSLGDADPDRALIAAAKLLLVMTEVLDAADIPAEFRVINGTRLYADSLRLASNALATTEYLAENSAHRIGRTAAQAKRLLAPMSDDLLAKGVEIADECMRELLRGHTLRVAMQSGQEAFLLADETGAITNTLGKADPAIQEAFAWLSARGLATLGVYNSGEVIVVRDA